MSYVQTRPHRFQIPQITMTLSKRHSGQTITFHFAALHFGCFMKKNVKLWFDPLSALGESREANLLTNSGSATGSNANCLNGCHDRAHRDQWLNVLCPDVTPMPYSRPLASDMPTEAFNGCCLERLVRRRRVHNRFFNAMLTSSVLVTFSPDFVVPSTFALGITILTKSSAAGS